MANTYTLIASSTVGAGGAASITFSSIPSTYTDLLIKTSLRNSGGQNNASLTFNSDSGSNYSYKALQGSGSAVTSFGGTSQTQAYGLLENDSSYTANTFASTDFYIPNYAGSNQKSTSSDSVQETNATAAYSFFLAGLWTGTSAISNIVVNAVNGTFAQYSTAYLYGIKNS